MLEKLSKLTRRMLGARPSWRPRRRRYEAVYGLDRPVDALGDPVAVNTDTGADVVGYVTGWRMWSLRQLFDEGLRLQSPVMGLCWRPGRAMRGWPAHPPQGIYALARHEDPQPIGRQWLGAGEAVLGGAVALWGEVHEHRQGWRAQFAYPLSLGWLSTYCGDCAKLVPARALRVDQEGGFIRQGGRGEFVMLCQRCARVRIRNARRFVRQNDDPLADTRAVLIALRRAYLPYLADACERSEYALGLES